jgi:hypothetical protein
LCSNHGMRRADGLRCQIRFWLRPISGLHCESQSPTEPSLLMRPGTEPRPHCIPMHNDCREGGGGHCCIAIVRRTCDPEPNVRAAEPNPIRLQSTGPGTRPPVSTVKRLRSGCFKSNRTPPERRRVAGPFQADGSDTAGRGRGRRGVVGCFQVTGPTFLLMPP